MTCLQRTFCKNGHSSRYEAKLIKRVLISLCRDKYLPMKQKLRVLAGEAMHQQLQLPQQERALTSRLISSCRSGAERAVALIMVDVWLSVSFLMQR